MMDFAAARRAMVDCQVRPSDVTHYGIIAAMLWAPRELFVPKSRRDVAYAGAEVPVAPGRTLMEPRIFAKMLEEADIGPRDLVLDLGCANGYSTAVIARMAEAVVGIDPDAALIEQGRGILNQLEVHNAALSAGPLAEGDAAHGPFDVIMINGAAEVIPPMLTAQLKEGGRLVAIRPMGEFGQCRVLTRAGNALSDRYAFDATASLLEGFRRAPSFTF